MNNITETLIKYTSGKMTLEDANTALAEASASFHLDPEKNLLTEEEKRATTIGYYPDQVNGFGLLDTGTGTLDKVRAKDGKLVNCDCGNMYALFTIAGRTYEVKGDTLMN